MIAKLQAAGVDPRNVVVEITESTAMADPDRTQKILTELHAWGLTLAIDDFGTGYSSLARLKHMPVDILKIDQAFVRDCDTDRDLAGMVRAMIQLAQSLGVEDTRAVSFAIDEEESSRFLREYQQAGLTMPVDLSAAPYRDIGTPLLAYIRELTEDPDTVVNIVMPEIVVRGWARFLHNQRALYIKRLLLFEPHVILSSVPYQLFR